MPATRQPPRIPSSPRGGRASGRSSLLAFATCAWANGTTRDRSAQRAQDPKPMRSAPDSGYSPYEYASPACLPKCGEPVKQNPFRVLPIFETRPRRPQTDCLDMMKPVTIGQAAPPRFSSLTIHPCTPPIVFGEHHGLTMSAIGGPGRRQIEAQIVERHRPNRAGGVKRVGTAS